MSNTITTPATPQLIESLGSVYPNETAKHKAKMGIFKCSCGNIFKAREYEIRKGHTKSCGCYRKKVEAIASKTHGLSKTRLYKIWVGIKRRINNAKSSVFAHYGGRGISICEEWSKDFMAFYDWSNKNGYHPSASIDRIDNDGNYEPSNCRWADDNTQAQNTKTIRKHNTTGYRGVSFVKQAQKYSAHIRVNKKLKHLGYFTDPVEAAKAYDSYIALNNLEHTKNFI